MPEVLPVHFDFTDNRMLRLNAGLAKEIGLNESIVFLQIQFLIKNSNNERDGKRWTYQTLDKLRAEYLPFLSRSALDRAITNLKNMGVLVVASFNAKSFDRTRWFAIDEEKTAKLSSLIISQNETRY